MRGEQEAHSHQMAACVAETRQALKVAMGGGYGGQALNVAEPCTWLPILMPQTLPAYPYLCWHLLSVAARCLCQVMKQTCPKFSMLARTSGSVSPVRSPGLLRTACSTSPRCNV